MREGMGVTMAVPSYPYAGRLAKSTVSDAMPSALTVTVWSVAVTARMANSAADPGNRMLWCMSVCASRASGDLLVRMAVGASVSCGPTGTALPTSTPIECLRPPSDVTVTKMSSAYTGHMSLSQPTAASPDAVSYSPPAIPNDGGAGRAPLPFPPCTTTDTPAERGATLATMSSGSSVLDGSNGVVYVPTTPHARAAGTSGNTHRRSVSGVSSLCHVRSTRTASPNMVGMTSMSSSALPYPSTDADNTASPSLTAKNMPRIIPPSIRPYWNSPPGPMSEVNLTRLGSLEDRRTSSMSSGMYRAPSFSSQT